MAVSPQQAADGQGETQLHNHYCDGRTVYMTHVTSTAASCLISFIPGRQQNARGGVNKASSSVESGDSMYTEA